MTTQSPLLPWVGMRLKLSQLLVFILSVTAIPASCGASKPPRVTITIAVHGAVSVMRHLFNIVGMMKDTLIDDACLHEHLLCKRGHTGFFQDQLLLDDGLVIIPQQALDACRAGKLTTQQRKVGAVYLYTLYDDLAHQTRLRGDVAIYATFGWSGILGHRSSQQASIQLYQDLCALIAWCQATYGVRPEITLLGYSRGGHAILYLAAQELLHERGLSIERVVFFGVPLQHETAMLIASPIFKSIISCYSYGDIVQKVDIPSTKSRTCYRKLADFVDCKACQACGLTRADVQVLAGHMPWRINHFNWWIMHRVTPVFTWFDPLPLVSILPLVLHHLEPYTKEHTDFLVCLHRGDGALCIKNRCKHYSWALLAQSPSYRAMIERFVAFTRHWWDHVSMHEAPELACATWKQETMRLLQEVRQNEESLCMG